MLSEQHEVRSVFPLMRELREHLDEQTFWQLYQTANLESGYTLFGAFRDDTCLGLLGFRILTDLVHGRHLYVDDLVVSEKHRSQGLGARLLNMAKEIAAEKNCRRLRLCTGTQNDKGKSFYERNGWQLKAVVYKTQI